jgi:hypothetical protein
MQVGPELLAGTWRVATAAVALPVLLYAGPTSPSPATENNSHLCSFSRRSAHSRQHRNRMFPRACRGQSPAPLLESADRCSIVGPRQSARVRGMCIRAISRHEE